MFNSRFSVLRAGVGRTRRRTQWRRRCCGRRGGAWCSCSTPLQRRRSRLRRRRHPGPEQRCWFLSVHLKLCTERVCEAAVRAVWVGWHILRGGHRALYHTPHCSIDPIYCRTSSSPRPASWRSSAASRNSRSKSLAQLLLRKALRHQSRQQRRIRPPGTHCRRTSPAYRVACA